MNLNKERKFNRGKVYPKQLNSFDEMSNIQIWSAEQEGIYEATAFLPFHSI